MVILFAHNIQTASQVRALCRKIHALPGRPLIAVDLEGGRVNRMKGLWGNLPGAAEYGRWASKKIEALAHEWGRRLARLGIDVDFAPVVDLGPAASGTGLEGRTLGDTPEDVIRRARAFIRGLHSAGVYSCIKHFPGLGASTLDSHKDLPRIGLKAGPLLRNLRPFRALKNVSPMVMVAHGLYPALDPSGVPASLSRTVISLLDKRPAFHSLVLSDDLEMGALRSYGSLARRAELALRAGCHMAIVSHEWRRIPEITHRLQRGRFLLALARFEAWKDTPLDFWSD
jgi:beta-N-acetylhexosaminidase